MLALWMLIQVTVTFRAVYALPCCKTSPLIEVGHSLQCQPEDDSGLAELHDVCEGGVLTISPITANLMDPPMIENARKTLLRVGNDKWTDEYCTGTLSNNTNMDILVKTDKAVIMVCWKDEVVPNFTLYGVCAVISSVFLFLTLIIYIWLPELRDLQGKCIMCLVLCFMLSYMILSFIQLPSTTPEISSTACVISAFLLYFWMLSAFLWLNLSSFNMWLSIVFGHLSISETKLMRIYSLIGWGTPACAVCLALLTHHLGEPTSLQPRFGFSSCWFETERELWVFFYGPIAAILICNTAYFVTMAMFLWFGDYNLSHQRNLRTKFLIYFRLFLSTGMLWTFEIISAIHKGSWIITDVLNMLQGVIIFLLMIGLRKRVRHLIASRNIFPVGCGICWQRMDDVDALEDFTISAH